MTYDQQMSLLTRLVLIVIIKKTAQLMRKIVSFFRTRYQDKFVFSVPSQGKLRKWLNEGKGCESGRTGNEEISGLSLFFMYENSSDRSSNVCTENMKITLNSIGKSITVILLSSNSSHIVAGLSLVVDRLRSIKSLVVSSFRLLLL